MNITFEPSTPYCFPCILLFPGQFLDPFRQPDPKACVCSLRHFHRHTLTQCNLYRVTSIVGTHVFESNGPRRANQYADHTSGSPALDELGQPADLAAQPRLGILPERGPGPGRRNPTRFVASWKNLKSPAELKSDDRPSAIRAGTGLGSAKTWRWKHQPIVRN